MRQRRSWVSWVLTCVLVLQIALIPSPGARALAHPGHSDNAPGPATAPGAPSPPSQAQPLPARAQWVEDVTKRTAYAKQFQTGDQMVTEISATPVHRKDAGGKWVDIDTTLVDDGQGSLGADLGSFKVSFTKQAQHNKLHVDLQGGQSLEMGLDEEVPDETLPDTPRQKVAGRHMDFAATSPVKGKMKYQEKQGRMDYEYSVDVGQVKELITLRKYAGKSTFVFPLALNGLTAQEDGSGGLRVLDSATGELRAVIPPAWAADANGVEAPGVTQTLVSGALQVTVDDAWLAAPGRKYPVVVDPSVTIAPSQGADLMMAGIFARYDGQDCSHLTLSRESGGPNYIIRIYNDYGETDSFTCMWEERRALVKFDLTSLPAGAVVTSATFSAPPFDSVSYYEEPDEWTPTAAKWSTPRGTGTTWSGGPGGMMGAALTTNMTTLVQAWVNRTKLNNGILVSANRGSGKRDFYNPTLQVSYTVDSVPPAVTLSGISGGQAVSQAIPVTVTTSDNNGIALVEVLVDGVPAGQTRNPTAAANTFTVDPRQFGPGSHTVVARTFDFAGNTAATTPVAFTATIPEEPRSAVGTSGPSGISLKWEAPVGAAALTYNVYRLSTQTVTPSAADRVATGVTATGYTDTTAPATTAPVRYYAVSAVDASGAESRAAVIAVPLTATTTPASLAGVAPTPAAVGTVPVTNLSIGPTPAVTPTFIRSSDAYSDAGIKATTNIPRFVQGVRGQSLWLEEGASNLFAGSHLYWYNEGIYPPPTTNPDPTAAWGDVVPTRFVHTSGGSVTITRLKADPIALASSQVGSTSYAAPTGSLTSTMSVLTAGSAMFDELRLSNRARTDAEIQAGPANGMPVDSSTVYKFGFDGSLQGAIVPTGNPQSTLSLAWGPSATNNATYHIYRGEKADNPGAPGLVTLSAGSSGTTLTDAMNLLANTSFEQAAGDGTPNGWTWLSATHGGGTTTAATKFGATALGLTRDATMSGTTQGVTQTVALNQAEAAPVTLSGWSKAAGIAGGGASDYGLSVTLLDGGGQMVGIQTLAFDAGTHDWQQKSVTITPSAPAVTAVVQARLTGAVTGSAWFDGIQLQPGTTLTGWTEGPVVPGKAYVYQVIAVDPAGSAAPPVSIVGVGRPWKLTTAATGEAPGLGLDDRWSFADMSVPGGTAYLNATTGNVVVTATDSVVPGPKLAQVFRRTYNSQATAGAGPLGSQGWSLNAIQTLQQDVPTGNVILVEGDGTRLTFVKNGDGTYTAPPAVWMTLSATTGSYAWHIQRRDGIAYDFDSAGRMVRLGEPNGNAIVYGYDGSGRMTSVSGPSTRQASLEYDATGRITAIHDAGGATWTYAYDAGGRLGGVTDPLNQTLQYAYDANGRLSAITDAGGRSVQVAYDGQGRLASYTWANVRGTAQFSYSQTRDLNQLTVVDPLGNTSLLLTNATGNLVQSSDALGNNTVFEYDSLQRLNRVITPRGLATDVAYEGTTPRVTTVTRWPFDQVVTTFGSYNAFDKPGLITDPMGAQTEFQYDPAGNPLKQTVGYGTALAAATTFTYQANGMPATVTDALGNKVIYEVDALGQVTAITNPAGGRTVMTYDAAGNLITATDPNGHLTTTMYDALGRRLQVTYADGGTAISHYNRSGFLVEETKPGGVRTTYAYDGAGRPVSQTDSAGYTTQVVYDDAGRPVATLLPNGTATRQEYDALGRVIRAYDGNNVNASGNPAAGAVFTEYGYDAAGNPTWVRLPTGYTQQGQYDLNNLLTLVSTPPNLTQFTYDRMGRKLTGKDGNGNWTRYQYDAQERLTTVYDAANLTSTGTIKAGAVSTSYAYDLLGRQTSVTDPMGGIRRYEYSPLGQVVKETDPNGAMVSQAYDTAGQLTSVFNRNGSQTTYEYDPVGRVLAVRYPDDRDSVVFTYDAAGRRVSMVDQTGVTYYQYDAVGRLKLVTNPDGATGYTYDPAGLRTGIQLAEGTIAYTYDQANRVKTVTDINRLTSTVTYNADGAIANMQLPGYVSETISRDPSTNRITQLRYQSGSGSGSRFLNYGYQYDAVGNLTKIETTGSDWKGYSVQPATTYGYDALNRLVSVRTGDGGPDGRYTNYGYDVNGNKTSVETGYYMPYTQQSYTQYSYGLGNILLSSWNANTYGLPSGATQYSYDGEGNLTQLVAPDHTDRYTYNTRNQLVKLQSSTSTNSRFTYDTFDGDGYRISRRVADSNMGGAEVAAESSRFQYDGLFVIATRDAAGGLKEATSRLPNGRLLSWYVPGPGPSPTDNGGAFLLDHLGSVVDMIKGTDGTVANGYDYDAFGNAVWSTENVANEFKFTGAVLDGSGLYHLGARFYSPGMGRFITQDTYRGNPWEPWTQNLYAYVGNNPVNYVDPTGHWGEPIALGWGWEWALGFGTAVGEFFGGAAAIWLGYEAGQMEVQQDCHSTDYGVGYWCNSWMMSSNGGSGGSGGSGGDDDGGNKPRKVSDLPKPGDNLTSDPGKAGRAQDMTKKEVEDAIHNIKGKAKVDMKLSGGRKNPDVFIDKETGDVYWNYQGRVGSKIGNILNPPHGR